MLTPADPSPPIHRTQKSAFTASIQDLSATRPSPPARRLPGLGDTGQASSAPSGEAVLSTPERTQPFHSEVAKGRNRKERSSEFFRIERSGPPDGGPARVNPDQVPEHAFGRERDSNDCIPG